MDAKLINKIGSALSHVPYVELENIEDKNLETPVLIKKEVNVSRNIKNSKISKSNGKKIMSFPADRSVFHINKAFDISSEDAIRLQGFNELPKASENRENINYAECRLRKNYVKGKHSHDHCQPDSTNIMNFSQNLNKIQNSNIGTLDSFPFKSKITPNLSDKIMPTIINQNKKKLKNKREFLINRSTTKGNIMKNQVKVPKIYNNNSSFNYQRSIKTSDGNDKVLGTLETGKHKSINYSQEMLKNEENYSRFDARKNYSKSSEYVNSINFQRINEVGLPLSSKEVSHKTNKENFQNFKYSAKTWPLKTVHFSSTAEFVNFPNTSKIQNRSFDSWKLEKEKKSILKHSCKVVESRKPQTSTTNRQINKNFNRHRHNNRSFNLCQCNSMAKTYGQRFCSMRRTTKSGIFIDQYAENCECTRTENLNLRSKPQTSESGVSLTGKIQNKISASDSETNTTSKCIKNKKHLETSPNLEIKDKNRSKEDILVKLMKISMKEQLNNHGYGCRFRKSRYQRAWFIQEDIGKENALYFMVLPGLYVGNFRDSKDQDQLSRFQITHILSIHDNARKLPCNQDKEYLCIIASDSPGQNLIQFFTICNDFIHSARCKGGAVLIHCLAGMSRSVTVAVIYVMSVTTLGWREALKAVQGARNVANPNVGFLKQIQEFENERLQDERRRVREKYPTWNLRGEDEKMAREMLSCYYYYMDHGSMCDGNCQPLTKCPRGLCNQNKSLIPPYRQNLKDIQSNNKDNLKIKNSTSEIQNLFKDSHAEKIGVSRSLQDMFSDLEDFDDFDNINLSCNSTPKVRNKNLYESKTPPISPARSNYSYYTSSPPASASDSPIKRVDTIKPYIFKSYKNGKIIHWPSSSASMFDNSTLRNENSLPSSPKKKLRNVASQKSPSKGTTCSNSYKIKASTSKSNQHSQGNNKPFQNTFTKKFRNKNKISAKIINDNNSENKDSSSKTKYQKSISDSLKSPINHTNFCQNLFQFFRGSQNASTITSTITDYDVQNTFTGSNFFRRGTETRNSEKHLETKTFPDTLLNRKEKRRHSAYNYIKNRVLSFRTNRKDETVDSNIATQLSEVKTSTNGKSINNKNRITDFAQIPKNETAITTNQFISSDKNCILVNPIHNIENVEKICESQNSKVSQAENGIKTIDRLNSANSVQPKLQVRNFDKEILNTAHIVSQDMPYLEDDILYVETRTSNNVGPSSHIKEKYSEFMDNKYNLKEYETTNNIKSINCPSEASNTKLSNNSKMEEIVISTNFESVLNKTSSLKIKVPQERKNVSESVRNIFKENKQFVTDYDNLSLADLRENNKVEKAPQAIASTSRASQTVKPESTDIRCKSDKGTNAEKYVSKYSYWDNPTTFTFSKNAKIISQDDLDDCEIII